MAYYFFRAVIKILRKISNHEPITQYSLVIIIDIIDSLGNKTFASSIRDDNNNEDILSFILELVQCL